MNNLKRLLLSFKYALKGLYKVFLEERNFQIHSAIAFIVLMLALFLKISSWELIALILVIGLVLILEIINSIFERLLDLFKPRMHQYVKDIKDMTAAAVFVSAVVASLVGLLIFGPYLIK